MDEQKCVFTVDGYAAVSYTHLDGFYDGDGVYKVRFMPAFEGEYTFRAVSYTHLLPEHIHAAEFADVRIQS